MLEKYIKSMKKIAQEGNDVLCLYNFLKILIDDNNNQDQQNNENSQRDPIDRSAFVFFKPNRLKSDEVFFIKNLIKIIDNISTNFSIISTEINNREPIDAKTLITFVMDYKDNNFYKWNKIKKTYEFITKIDWQKDVCVSLPKSDNDPCANELIERSVEDLVGVHNIGHINVWDDYFSLITSYLNTYQEKIYEGTQLSQALGNFFSWFPQYWPLLCDPLQKKLKYFNFLQKYYEETCQHIITSIKDFDSMSGDSQLLLQTLSGLPKVVQNFSATMQQELIKVLLEKLDNKTIDVVFRIKIYSILFELRKFIDEKIKNRVHTALMNITEDINNLDYNILDRWDNSFYLLSEMKKHVFFWKNDEIKHDNIDLVFSFMTQKNVDFFNMLPSLKKVIYSLCSYDKLPEERGSLFARELLELLKNSSENVQEMGLFIFRYLHHWIPEAHRKDFVNWLVLPLIDNQCKRSYFKIIRECYFPIIQPWIPEEDKSYIGSKYLEFLVSIEDDEEDDGEEQTHPYLSTVAYSGFPINLQLSLIKAMACEGARIDFLVLYPIWEQNIKNIQEQVMRRGHETPYIYKEFFSSVFEEGENKKQSLL